MLNMLSLHSDSVSLQWKCDKENPRQDGQVLRGHWTEALGEGDHAQQESESPPGKSRKIYILHHIA